MIITELKIRNIIHYKCICDNCKCDFDTLNKRRTKVCLICSFKHLNFKDDRVIKRMNKLWKF